MSDAPKRPRRPAGPPPNAARLREAALAHLARFAATEAGLRRVLERRIARWARAAEAEGQAREAIAASTAAKPSTAASMYTKSPASVPNTAPSPAPTPPRAVAFNMARVPGPGMSWKTRIAATKLP